MNIPRGAHASPTANRAPWPRMARRGWTARALLVVIAMALGIGMPGARSRAETPAPDAAGGSPRTVTPGAPAARVVAYYFHTRVRCASCRSIEAYTHEAIQSGFEDEMKTGQLVWKVVDIETRGNEHFVKDFGLYTKSVILVTEVPGKPAAWKNLADVWKLLPDKPRFLRYVQAEVRRALDESS